MSNGYFPADYWTPRYWPTGWSNPLPFDLLDAIVAFLQSTLSVTALVPAASIYGPEFLGTAGASRPFIVVPDYVEHLPGESLEDEQITVQVVIVTEGTDDAQARQIGAAVKAALDNANTNPLALGRGALAWQGGTETAALRNDSRPRRMPGIGRGGAYVFVEEIPYEFWATPEQ